MSSTVEEEVRPQRFKKKFASADVQPRDAVAGDLYGTQILKEVFDGRISL